MTHQRETPPLGAAGLVNRHSWQDDEARNKPNQTK